MAKRYPYTQKTLKWAREKGWTCHVVEKFNRFSNKREDMFGIIDIVAMTGCEIVGIQSTSYGSRKPHIKTLTHTQAKSTAKWLQSNGGLILVSWKRVKRVRGGKAFKYVPVVDEITLEDLEQ